MYPTRHVGFSQKVKTSDNRVVTFTVRKIKGTKKKINKHKQTNTNK